MISNSRLALGFLIAPLIVMAPAGLADEREKNGAGVLELDERRLEAREGDGVLRVEVERSHGEDGAVTVRFSTMEGSATAGEDYEAVSGILEWADGEDGERVFEVPILDDEIEEGRETFRVLLAEPTGGAEIDSVRGQATIVIDANDGPGQADDGEDDDEEDERRDEGPGRFKFDRASFNVFEEDGVATISVERQRGTAGAVSVLYATSDGTAIDGLDYTGVSGMLDWADGENGSKSFQVPILDDDEAEGLETVLLTLSDPTGGAEIHSERGRSTLRIRPSDRDGDEEEDDEQDDEEGPGTIRLRRRSIEVREGSGFALLVAERKNGETGMVTVDYETADGSALAGEDYVTAAGVLTWEDGDDADKAFVVELLDDDAMEGEEEFEVRLLGPTGGAELHAERDRTTVHIVEDDRGSCEASATVLCLLGNRFQVEAAFTTADGMSGAAQNTQVSDSTGLLWFFDESNVEILVKMLDACGVRGLPGFWVFTAATTDLEVALSITDTVTGLRQDYLSPRGEVGPITIDVMTFNDCH